MSREPTLPRPARPARLAGLAGLALVLALALVPALGACTVRSRPTAPADAGAGPAAPAAAAYSLGHRDALTALRRLRVAGFERVVTCASRRPRSCRAPGTRGAGWFAGAQLNGADLPRGNGLGAWVRVMVTAWPSAATAAAYSHRLTTRLRRYDGEYDVLLRHTAPGRYIPADRGRGELHPVALDGWRGTVLRRIFHYVFADLSPSAPVPGGHAVLSQGRYVVDVEWVARSQASDRRLSALTRRLLRALS